ncbi:hypothetical protein SAMN05518871_106221 [Psychrobacillus sp. OK028]|uniref:hypothetical protein n=1 Tax=Psychrobacillus sp. OK028 TaxID=1884359 RepID=UPI000888A2B9|nr:hypothetical protein [Psychrobacillus sp. OK028]SDN64461.1 hypothetical protein SAMN05518871_106221 [Psychrobacillus sp. OK028]
MKRFLSKNIHWLLLIFVIINLIIGFSNFTYSKQDLIAIIFGIVGLLGVTYLVIHIESKKRRGKERE